MIINNTKILFFGVKQRVKEFFKYDLGIISLPQALLFYFIASSMLKLKNYRFFFDIAGILHSSNWYKSEELSIRLGNKKVLQNALKSAEFKAAIDNYIENYDVHPSRKKFVENPTKLFKNTLIVISEATEHSKGLLILKYSFYFILFLKLFRANKVLENYHLVLEPSWAGYLNLDIFAFTTLKHPVFVMCYEKRDELLLRTLGSNLHPVPVGPNWWCPPIQLQHRNNEKYYDLVIVASWSEFKRHYFIFKALKKVKESKPDLRVCLIGYEGDLSKQFILDIANYFDLAVNLSVLENVEAEVVFRTLQRSKASILWSRFEGNNRAIIESMACGTPVVFREGHNFGTNYPYINDKTALIANEKSLPKALVRIFDSYENYKPKHYVDVHHNFEVATQVIESCISGYDSTYQHGNAAHKVNYLWGMGYAIKESEERFEKDYSSLMFCIRDEKK